MRPPLLLVEPRFDLAFNPQHHKPFKNETFPCPKTYKTPLLSGFEQELSLHKPAWSRSMAERTAQPQEPLPSTITPRKHNLPPQCTKGTHKLSRNARTEGKTPQGGEETHTRLTPLLTAPPQAAPPH